MVVTNEKPQRCPVYQKWFRGLESHTAQNEECRSKLEEQEQRRIKACLATAEQEWNNARKEELVDEQAALAKRMQPCPYCHMWFHNLNLHLARNRVCRSMLEDKETQSQKQQGQVPPPPQQLGVLRPSGTMPQEEPVGDTREVSDADKGQQRAKSLLPQGHGASSNECRSRRLTSMPGKQQQCPGCKEWFYNVSSHLGKMKACRVIAEQEWNNARKEEVADEQAALAKQLQPCPYCHLWFQHLNMHLARNGVCRSMLEDKETQSQKQQGQVPPPPQQLGVLRPSGTMPQEEPVGDTHEVIDADKEQERAISRLRQAHGAGTTKIWRTWPPVSLAASGEIPHQCQQDAVGNKRKLGQEENEQLNQIQQATPLLTLPQQLGLQPVPKRKRILYHGSFFQSAKDQNGKDCHVLANDQDAADDTSQTARQSRAEKVSKQNTLMEDAVTLCCQPQRQRKRPRRFEETDSPSSMNSKTQLVSTEASPTRTRGGSKLGMSRHIGKKLPSRAQRQRKKPKRLEGTDSHASMKSDAPLGSASASPTLPRADDKSLAPTREGKHVKHGAARKLHAAILKGRNLGEKRGDRGNKQKERPRWTAEEIRMVKQSCLVSFTGGI